LKTDYVDLFLLHQPFADVYGAYQALEDAQKAGKVRAIGLSNFYQERFDEVLSMATITPTVLQNERNPFDDVAVLRYTITVLVTRSLTALMCFVGEASRE
jgi:diketogulonate reductase-like aldo/keto reductase